MENKTTISEGVMAAALFQLEEMAFKSKLALAQLAATREAGVKIGTTLYTIDEKGMNRWVPGMPLPEGYTSSYFASSDVGLWLVHKQTTDTTAFTMYDKRGDVLHNVVGYPGLLFSPGEDAPSIGRFEFLEDSCCWEWSFDDATFYVMIHEENF